MSDGAITAIALGSTFAGLGILSGIGYYFYRKAKNLQAGLVCGEKCPYQTIDCKMYSDVLTNKRKYTYLMKASERSKSDPDFYYLLIPDIKIKPKSFNTIFFELPENIADKAKFRIIQASENYRYIKNLPELDSDIFINPKDKDVKKISSYASDIDSKGGFLIKNGILKPSRNNIFVITTQNHSEKDAKIYAIIVEFWLDE